MYHTSDKNQHFSKNKNSFHPDFVYDFTQSVKNNYVNTLTRCGKNIAHAIKQFSQHEFTELKISTIAKMARCSSRTVSTFINKFHRDGFITKSQKNPYAPNVFEQNCVHYKSLLLDKYLFINPSLRTRRRERFFKNKYPKKGNVMNDFANQFPNMAKAKQKRRNDGGHSPAILKQVLSLEDQIHAKKVDIAFFTKQLENPESFWDPHGILFSANVSMAKSLLARAQFELNELEGVSNEKQSVLHQYQSSIMA